MRQKHSVMAYVWLAIFACLIPAGGYAGDAGSIKERMKMRLSKIDSLKANKLVGESNRAYLEERGSLSAEQQNWVKQENADRKALYAIIAKSAAVSIKTVEKQRASQIAKRSGPGIWLQGANGKWYIK